KAIAAAFNAHDLDAIMDFFADDCILEMPRGPEPWGQRFTGKAAVREGLASRFKGLPDVHYGDGRHWVSGNLGVSEWLLTGTRPDDEMVRVRGCDHWEFRDGKGIRKDSYWKIVEKTAWISPSETATRSSSPPSPQARSRRLTRGAGACARPSPSRRRGRRAAPFLPRRAVLRAEATEAAPKTKTRRAGPGWAGPSD